ncbi:MAG: response regulator transcription factor [Pseudomonadota bacterium]
MRVLIVEDNPDIAGNVGDFLGARGHEVDFAGNGAEGLRLATSEAFDAIVLDINLPRMDGFELCRRLREEHAVDTPVLMLTARDSLSDKTSGFQAGAWDYLVKPFALEELAMRLDALTLRQQANRPRRLTLGELALDTAAMTAKRSGQPLKLHKASLRLLEVLMRAAPNVVTRQELEYVLWGDSPPDSNPLRSHLSELRRELDKPFGFAMLRTVHGVGYRLVDSDDAQ